MPDAPLRQWVLSVPFALRPLLAARNAAVAVAIRAFVAELAPACQTGATAHAGRRRARRGSKGGALEDLARLAEDPSEPGPDGEPIARERELS